MGRDSSSNRTKLELKCYAPWPVHLKLHSSNRTKLELKFAKRGRWLHHAQGFQSNQTGIEIIKRAGSSLRILTLPIEPNWNWNNGYSVHLGNDEFTSNRTKLELKWSPNSKGVTPIKASNRTKLELKLNMQFCLISLSKTFQSNQTGIEILMDTKPPTWLNLPIEPNWNWNLR